MFENAQSFEFKKIGLNILEVLRMKKLTISFQNCFGINKLDCEMDFSRCNACTIYARNGMMKTSFSNTFQCVQDGKEHDIRDKIFDLPAVVDIKADGNEISPQDVFVIKSFESYYESKNLAALLVNSSVKAMITDLLNLQKDIFAALSKKSGIKIEKTVGGRKIPDMEPILIRDLQLKHESFLLSLDHIQIDEQQPYFGDIKYNDVLDEDVVSKVILSDEFQANIDQFLQKAEEICKKNPFLSMGKLMIPGLSKISTELKKQNFFVNDNQLQLTGGVSISSTAALEDTLKQITKELNATDEFKRLAKVLSDARGMALRRVLESHAEIIPYLAKNRLDEFKILLWNSYLIDLKDEFQALKNLYNSVKKKLSEEKFEQTPWEKALAIFNSRFSVPFTMEIANKESAVLGESLPRVEFRFEKKGVDNDVVMNRSKLEQLEILSQGEKRALYLLNIIFDIEQRQMLGQDTLYIIDDIADSFDYKNKYAIIEYLFDLKQNSQNNLIILSHNFDFYRTVSSRLGVLRKNRLIAENTNDDTIRLRQETYQKVFFKVWREKLDNPKYYLAMIPFVRNFIEYGYDYSVLQTKFDCNDFNVLTSLLHLKAITEQITIEDISQLYNKYLFGDENNVSNPNDYQARQSIVECLNEEAGKIEQNSVSLENKIILSMAIRLSAEDFMIGMIQSKGNKFEEPDSNQTRYLITKMKKDNYLDSKGDADIFRILDAVNIVTPEQIHVNSFMYEPLVDMDIIELLELYNQVKNLNALWARNHCE